MQMHSMRDQAGNPSCPSTHTDCLHCCTCDAAVECMSCIVAHAVAYMHVWHITGVGDLVLFVLEPDGGGCTTK